MSSIGTYFDDIERRLTALESALMGIRAEKPEAAETAEIAPAEAHAPEFFEDAAPVAQAQTERATESEAESVSAEVEKTPAPVAPAQVERAPAERGETPSGDDLESVRVRVSAVIRGTRPGAEAVAQAFRDRIREGTLWPVSACNSWDRLDKLTAFLDAAGF